MSTVSECWPRKTMTCFGAYLYSAGIQHRNLHQLSVTMSRVTCFILCGFCFGFSKNQRLCSLVSTWIAFVSTARTGNVAHARWPLSPHELRIIISHHHHHHLSLNREGRLGNTDDFATSFLHFSLFSTALCDLANSRSVHSLMLSSHLFLYLPCLLLPFTVSCKMV